MFPGKTRLLASVVALISLLVLGAAILAVVETVRFQRKETERTASVTGLVIGLERQLLHFRGDLATALAARTGLQEAAARYEILVSRISLVHSSPGIHVLESGPEHRVMLAHLQQIAAVGDRWAAAPSANLAEAQQLLALINRALPDMQSYTLAADLISSMAMESQLTQLRDQAVAISLLAVLQLGLVAFGLRVWWAWQKQQDATRTRLEHLTDELRQANVSAQEASRTKSQFLANMSHELRTPFQGVLGMLEILQKTQLSQQQAEMVHTAQESANHLLLILNEVLDISAIEAGRLSLHPAPLNPGQLCKEVESLMRVQAEDRGLLLRVSIAPDLPAHVMGDTTRIKQILFNLLNNAIKFTPAGTVSLEVRCTHPTAQTASLSFAVEDTGIGMDEHTQARLFKRFETGDGSLARHYGGAGLGLEISRNLARLMGGDLVAQSTLGQGSRFLLTLPLQLAEAQAEPQPVAPAAAGKVRRLNVLVADDHPINRHYLALVLQNFGHAVTLCDNGEEALEIVQTEAFDVVLMDVHMPVMDGLTATRAIRRMGGAHASMPILALTADVMPGARERALEAGVTAFLAKPVQIAQLGAALVQAAAREDTMAAPATPAGGFEVVSGRFHELQHSLPMAQMQDLLERFFADGSGALAELKVLLRSGTHRQVHAAAHKVKGSAAMLGLDRIATAARGIEDWADRVGDDGSRSRLEADLEAALAATRSALSPGH